MLPALCAHHISSFYSKVQYFPSLPLPQPPSLRSPVLHQKIKAVNTLLLMSIDTVLSTRQLGSDLQNKLFLFICFKFLESMLKNTQVLMKKIRVRDLHA